MCRVLGIGHTWLLTLVMPSLLTQGQSSRSFQSQILSSGKMSRTSQDQRLQPQGCDSRHRTILFQTTLLTKVLKLLLLIGNSLRVPHPLHNIIFTVFPDDNECLLNTHNCHINATCENTNGSFTCVCDPPLTGNGVMCSGKCVHLLR